MCIVFMSEWLLMPWLLCLDCLKTLINSKEYSLNQIKVKGKIKTSTHMVMVISDFIIMMPTLSININSFLNQTFLSFCLVSKNTWKWTFWCLPNLQICFQIILTSIQSLNVSTETRSPHFEIHPNQLSFINQCYTVII